MVHLGVKIFFILFTKRFKNNISNLTSPSKCLIYSLSFRWCNHSIYSAWTGDSQPWLAGMGCRLAFDTSGIQPRAAAACVNCFLHFGFSLFPSGPLRWWNTSWEFCFERNEKSYWHAHCVVDAANKATLFVVVMLPSATDCKNGENREKY